MERKKVKEYILALFVLFVIYGIGYNGLTIPEKSYEYASYTWIIMVVTAIITLIFHKSWRVKFINRFALVAVLGYVIEVIGVQTKLVFGSYNYGDTLGLKLFDTPLIIGLNWALVTYCALNITAPIKNDNSTRYLATAVLMVGMDIFLEPFAVRYALWHWGSDSAPLYNFVGWFIVSLGFAAFMGPVIKRVNPMALITYLAQILFFSMCQK